MINIFIYRGSTLSFTCNWTITKFNTKSNFQYIPECNISHLSLILCRNTMEPSTGETSIVAKCSCLIVRAFHLNIHGIYVTILQRLFFSSCSLFNRLVAQIYLLAPTSLSIIITYANHIFEQCLRCRIENPRS